VGLDIVGPLRKAPGGYTHLLVAIDKFSKWVEVRPITNLRAEQAVAFFTDIIHQFGMLLTPKIGTRKRLICGPSLVRKHHSAGNFP
jgi:hypothetical protein